MKIQSHPPQKIRLGIIGGGKDSFIGPVHRIAARMSDDYELVAGVFSSDPKRSMTFGQSIGITTNRVYPDWQTLLKAEQCRADGIEVIAIMTPNDTHVPISKAFIEAGIHIICDKPLCNHLEEAEALLKIVKASDRLFCVTYNYSAYPMVKQARSMVANGEIGEIKQVQLTYVQSNLAAYHPSEAQGWRHDTKKGGPLLVLGDIATHAFHLGKYVSRMEVEQIFAEVGPSFLQRKVDDYVTCLLRFPNSARGSMWVTNAAAGAEHGLSFRIFGTEGGLEWHQETPNELRHRRLNDFERILTRRTDGKLYPEAEQSVFLKFGHPEGYNEAFANLYKEMAKAINELKEGKKPLLPDGFPNVMAGLRGIAFIEACLKSKAKESWVNI